MLALFPSPYIHIGGDETPKARWKKCPDCQRRIRQQALKDEHALQVYFTNRIIAWLAKKGRRVIGWNEILEEGLTEDAVVQYWFGKNEKIVDAIRNQKRNVIISTWLKTYLDHSYALTPLSEAYAFEPAFPELTEKEAAPILGIEAPLWTEWVPDLVRLDYQTFPRLTAYAETAWSSKEAKNWTDFSRRLALFLPRLDKLGVAYPDEREYEPPRIARIFKIFSLMIPQRRIARKNR